MSFQSYWDSVGGKYECAHEDWDTMHDEALAMDLEYQKAIATIADNLSLTVWNGCSETVKAEVIKYHHGVALEVEARRRVAAFFGGMDYAARRKALDDAHAEALAINAAYDAQIAFYCKTPAFQKKAVEWAHADALAENAARAARLAKEVMLCDDHRSLFVKCDPFVQLLMLEDVHAEALAMNAGEASQ